MKKKQGYRITPFSANRKIVAASCSISKETNTIHGITEINVTKPRMFIKKHREKTGESLSFTAFVVTCFAKALSEYPSFNSFRKGNRLILLDDITIGVLIERELDGEKIPEPVTLHQVQNRSFQDIHTQIRSAQQVEDNRMGGLSDSQWIRLIPGFLLRIFIRLASRSITMAKKFGKTSVTAVGMFGKSALWFLPLTSATVTLTVGSIVNRPIRIEDRIELQEHLCVTISFNHDIIDGAPATRFTRRFSELLETDDLLKRDAIDET